MYSKSTTLQVSIPQMCPEASTWKYIGSADNRLMLIPSNCVDLIFWMEHF